MLTSAGRLKINSKNPKLQQNKIQCSNTHVSYHQNITFSYNRKRSFHNYNRIGQKAQTYTKLFSLLENKSHNLSIINPYLNLSNFHSTPSHYRGGYLKGLFSRNNSNEDTTVEDTEASHDVLVNRINEMIRMADEYSKNEQIDDYEATLMDAHYYAKLLYRSSPNSQDATFCYHECLKRLRKFCQDKNDLESAIVFANRAIEVSSESKHLAKEVELDDMYVLATMQFAAMRFSESEKLIENSLLKAQREVFGSNSRELQRSLYCLGLNKQQLGKLHEADKLLRQALDITDHTLARKDISNEEIREARSEVASILEAMAEVSSSLGRTAEVVPLMKSSLEFTRRVYGKVHLNVAFRMDKLAWYERANGNHEKALRYFKRALGMFAQTLGRKNDLYARCLYSFAITELQMLSSEIAQQNFDERVEQLLQSHRQRLEDASKGIHTEPMVVPPSSSSSSSTNGTTSWPPALNERQKETVDNIERRLHTAKQIFSLISDINPTAERVMDIVQLYSNLGRVYEMQGRFSEAYKMHSKALDLAQENKNIESMLQAYHCMGDHFTKTGKFSKAEDMLFKAVDIAQSLFPEESESVLSIRAAIAENWGHQNKVDEATQLFEELLRKAEQHFGSSHRLTDSIQRSLFSLQNKIENSQQQSTSKESTA